MKSKVITKDIRPGDLVATNSWTDALWYTVTYVSKDRVFVKDPEGLGGELNFDIKQIMQHASHTDE